MIEILIAIVAAIVAFSVLVFYGLNTERYMRGGLAFAIGAVGLIFCGISSLAYAFSAWGWFAADAKARIINREYGTNYTREEVFYASKVIEAIQHLNRQRIEVNGDLFRERKGEKK